MYWFAVRNYVSPEPAVVASGSVQSNRSVYYPTSSYGYDWMGNMLWARLYTNTTSYYQTNYTYDQSGNLLSVTNANGQNTTYKYDDLNRLIQTSYPNGTSQYMYYDNASNLIAKTDQNGNTINYTYDALNRLIQIRYPDGSTVNYTYDMNGNLLSDVEKNVSSYYQYDARNRLINETDVINGTAYTTLYTYDKASNILSIKYPDNTTLSYQYDFLNRVSSVVGYANFTYTVDSKISTINYANAVTTTYSYNSRDEPTRILAVYNSIHLMDLNYTYDGVGNALTINNETYSYDLLNRLTSSTGAWGVYNYTYDPVGNMLTLVQNGTSTSLVYGSNNQLTAMGSVNFTYDNNGNELTKVNGSSSWGYGYDYENRLVNVTLNSQLVQTNVYGCSGKRMMVTDNGSSTLYVYEGGAIIYEKNLTSGQITDHFYANGLQIASNVSGTPYYYQMDALGSIRIQTTSNVTQTFLSNYMPFGLSVGRTGTSEFQYADKPVDSITGLYYFGARFYDPSIYRFITADSYTGTQQDPLSQNRYIYAEDNPETNVDVNGNRIAASPIESDAIPPSSISHTGTTTTSATPQNSQSVKPSSYQTPDAVVATTTHSQISAKQLFSNAGSLPISTQTQSTQTKVPDINTYIFYYHWPTWASLIAGTIGILTFPALGASWASVITGLGAVPAIATTIENVYNDIIQHNIAKTFADLAVACVDSIKTYLSLATIWQTITFYAWAAAYTAGNIFTGGIVNLATMSIAAAYFTTNAIATYMELSGAYCATYG